MNPTATQAHHPPDAKGRLKGSIGIAKRVHYLLQVRKDPSPATTGWATSACRGWAGEVQFVDSDAWVTCSKCLQLERDRQVPKTVEV